MDYQSQVRKELEEVKDSTYFKTSRPCDVCRESNRDGFCAGLPWLCRLKADLFPYRLTQYSASPSLPHRDYHNSHMTRKDYIEILEQLTSECKYNLTLQFLLAHLHTLLLRGQPHLEREILSVESVLAHGTLPLTPMTERPQLDISDKSLPPVPPAFISQKLLKVDPDFVTTIRKLWENDKYLDSFNSKRDGVVGPCSACIDKDKATSCTRLPECDLLRQQLIPKGSLSTQFLYQPLGPEMTTQPLHYWGTIEHILLRCTTAEMALWMIVNFHHHMMDNNNNIHFMDMARKTEEAVFRMFLTPTF